MVLYKCKQEVNKQEDNKMTEFDIPVEKIIEDNGLIIRFEKTYQDKYIRQTTALIDQENVYIRYKNVRERNLDFEASMRKQAKNIQPVLRLFDIDSMGFNSLHPERDEDDFAVYKYLAEHADENWSKSPYNNRSFYSSKNIGWGYKPLGSYRVSDHWNFGENSEHCKTDNPGFKYGWAVGIMTESGKYDIIKKF